MYVLCKLKLLYIDNINNPLLGLNIQLNASGNDYIFKNTRRVYFMKKQTTQEILDNKLVLKIPGAKLPKTIEFNLLNARLQKAIIKAYNESTVYAPNLTASKSEKLSAVLVKQIQAYKAYLDELKNEPTPRDKADAFCYGFEFDSVETPNVVRLAYSLASNPEGFLNIDTLICILDREYNISVSPTDLYNEFLTWKYYETVKACVGDVSIVKFMKFFVGLICQN